MPDNRTLDEIYSLAKNESGPLNIIFGGSSAAAAAPIIVAFSAKYPEITVNDTTDLSKYVNTVIDRSYIVNKPYVDIAILQTVHDYPRWRDEGRLLKYKPSNFDDINNSIKDANGAYVPVNIYQFGPFYYDSTKVPPERVPKTYADVLDPYWKGKLVLTYPNDDDGVLNLFSLIISKYGFAWFDALTKQDVLWVRGASAASGTIISAHNSTNSSRSLTFTALGGFTPSTNFLKVQQPEAPEQFMSWGQLLGIFASTPRPESAKLFTSFLLSNDYQSSLAATSPVVLNSLNRQYGHNLFEANNTQVTGYITFMNDRARVEWWRMQIETTLGLPVGPDPPTGRN
ncbi:Fe3+ ABC transporter periplasmic protein [Xylogone sp. PMI_703]|nr:Fe3+ ABC transporter periplasmic protein [Xylogone sp. PMI_703]